MAHPYIDRDIFPDIYEIWFFQLILLSIITLKIYLSYFVYGLTIDSKI